MDNYWMSNYVGMASFDVHHLKVDSMIRQRWKIIGCPTKLVWPVLMCIIRQRWTIIGCPTTLVWPVVMRII